MKIKQVHTYLLVADLASAERWYAELFGRGPDLRPMATLVQWELTDASGVGLSTSEEIAATGAVFIIVDDLDAERRRLQASGLDLGDDIEGDYSTLAQVRDIDGNLITLATPPSRPYPPA